MIDESTLLTGLPAPLRTALLSEFKGIIQAYSESRWKLAGLDAGRFCEVVYTVLDGALSGKYASSPSKPSRFPDACKALENKPPLQIGDKSLRLLIPRVLPGLYEIRNNRDVGHVGGDVVSNKMDAAYLKSSAVWIMSELIRVFHQTSIHEAQGLVDSICELEHPLVWEMDGVRRVLNPKMSMPDKTLVLLNSVVGWCSLADLEEWIKADKNYRGNVIKRLADKLLIEYRAGEQRVAITPLGINRAEQILSSHNAKGKSK